MELTYGALKKLVKEELAKNKKLKEENGTGAIPGYLTPKAFKKTKI